MDLNGQLALEVVLYSQTKVCHSEAKLNSFACLPAPTWLFDQSTFAPRPVFHLSFLLKQATEAMVWLNHALAEQCCDVLPWLLNSPFEIPLWLFNDFEAPTKRYISIEI